MDLRRLRIGEWIAGLAGVALIVAQALSGLDVPLAILGALAVGLWLLTASARSVGPGLLADVLLVPVALTIAIVYLVGDSDVPTGIGLAGCVGVLAGALVAMRDERLSSPGRPTDQTGVPVSEPPRVETLPAPPPA